MNGMLLRATLAVGLALAVPATSPAEMTLESPGLAPSLVDGNGALHEAWGTVELRLAKPAGGSVTEQRYEESTVPVAMTVKTAGPITLTETAYRAPIWPGGVDVLEARLSNGAREPRPVCLEVALPEALGVGERTGAINGRPVFGLPTGVEPVREERVWGCVGGVVSMPGSARPEGDCDPAFKNISAGMGGVPIVYRFKVPAGAERNVVLGLCESHWSMPGQRPVELSVEGADPTVIDPVGEWGQHKPGCVLFNARDANEDGRIEVTVAPDAKAVDKNTILNVIWVFPPRVRIEMDEVLRGKKNRAAEYYVDIGGENDQLLYRGGTLKYDLTLAPGAAQILTFLLESPEGQAVPDMARTAWTPELLRKAAEDIRRAYAGATRER